MSCERVRFRNLYVFGDQPIARNLLYLSGFVRDVAPCHAQIIGPILEARAHDLDLNRPEGHRFGSISDAQKSCGDPLPAYWRARCRLAQILRAGAHGAGNCKSCVLARFPLELDVFL